MATIDQILGYTAADLSTFSDEQLAVILKDILEPLPVCLDKIEKKQPEAKQNPTPSKKLTKAEKLKQKMESLDEESKKLEAMLLE